ncbi:G1/S-specific cyclin cln3 [Cichlidogyrus casuarinus]|uniref:G1/S-specific cyclin cln3 n=1 Tax=Cichlidogyrus casuarinus TaxID=1844966 RepID=A0ABD2PLV3_9PLAT
MGGNCGKFGRDLTKCIRQMRQMTVYDWRIMIAFFILGFSLKFVHTITVGQSVKVLDSPFNDRPIAYWKLSYSDLTRIRDNKYDGLPITHEEVTAIRRMTDEQVGTIPKCTLQELNLHFVARSAPDIWRVLFTILLAFFGSVIVAFFESWSLQFIGVMMSSLAFGLGTVTFLSLIAFYRNICVLFFASGSALAGTMPVYRTEPWIVPFIPKYITIAISGSLMAASLLVYMLLLPRTKMSNFSWRSLIRRDEEYQLEPTLFMKLILVKAMSSLLLASALALYIYNLNVYFYHETQSVHFVRFMSYLMIASGFYAGCSSRKLICEWHARWRLHLPQLMFLVIFVLYAFFPYQIFTFFTYLITLFVGYFAGIVLLSTYHIIAKESPPQFKEFCLVVAAAVPTIEVLSTISAPILMRIVCRIK